MPSRITGTPSIRVKPPVGSTLEELLARLEEDSWLELLPEELLPEELLEFRVEELLLSSEPEELELPFDSFWELDDSLPCSWREELDSSSSSQEDEDTSSR